MSSSSSVLISHPHQSLEKHISAVNKLSKRALAAKHILPKLGQLEQLEKWRLLLVLFHDFGKSTVYFQHKIIQAVIKENPEYNGLDRSYVESFYQIYPKSKLEEEMINDPTLGSHAALGAYAIQGELVGENSLIKAILLEITKRHHGDLKNFDDLEFSVLDGRTNISLQTQWEKANRDDYLSILSVHNLKLPDELDNIFEEMDGPELCLTLSFDELLPASDIQPYVLTLFLFSLLLAADKGDLMVERKDWVANTYLFPKELVASYKKTAFKNSPIKAIDKARELAYQMVERNIQLYQDSPYYSISLPTGLGKTLTAFNAAIQLQNALASKYGQTDQLTIPKIIYCLPFTSVIDQNAAVLEEIFINAQIKEGYLARHHYLADWQSKKDGHEEGLSDSEKEYFTEGWEYPFTVTTFVQFLETLFSNKNRKLRKFHNIANAIVILDEVQNIPPSYFETVETMFKMLYECFNTRFLFVTATQPFLIAKDPVIELTGPEMRKTEEFFTKMNRIDLDVSIWKEGGKPLNELLDIFQHAIEQEANRSFLFIFSKVKPSQTAFQQLKEQNPNAELIYLSAAILPVLRKERILKIKNPPKGKQLIVVTTQVVEAGVDIDLDVVYRDFAPLDSINQSAGRCNRNGLKGRGQVRLFRSEKGTNNVYDAVLINITEKVLTEQINKQGGLVIPESAFFDMNTAYAKAIRTAIADGNNDSEMIAWMKALKFEKVSKKFKLINQKNNRYSVFINYCEAANEIWEKYCQTARIPDRWDRKKEMRKLRPKLLMYVVQFPEHCLPFDKKAEDIALVYLNRMEYTNYYSLETGYGIYQESSIVANKSVSL